MIKENLIKNIEIKLKSIYKDEYKPEFIKMMKSTIEKFEEYKFEDLEKISEKNVYLITYGDSIYEENVPTIDTLSKFLLNSVGDTITDVHILPMFEYTSDDGFSVVDYMKINPKLGDWKNINDLSKEYRLMFDFVANHMSKSSDWFKGYLKEEPKFKDYFIKRDDKFDYSNVVRPRTYPIIHEYKGENNSIKTAWTTFSEDQVDINIKHFPVFLETTEILLNYAYNAATSIRLDAIGFLWKESGTSCIHLEQTHEIIKIWRLILDYFKSNTQIITETNVPHEENISYFGNDDEAHMVYQFTLPPLTLYTLTLHDSTKLSTWAKSIDKISDNSTFFNFLASHDGIGMRPTEGILTEEEKQLLVDKVLTNGGKVSYKNNTDGTKSVYELNINYLDALINKDEDLSEEMQIQKILTAHAILLSFVGVPAIYYNSLIGSRNDYKGLEESGINRRINREKFEYNYILEQLDIDARRNKIFNELQNLINIRKQETSFSPYANQKVVEFDKDVFALERSNDTSNDKILFVANITSNNKILNGRFEGTNILNNSNIKGSLNLKPYEFVWIKTTK